MPTWGMWLILAVLLTFRGLLAAVEAALHAISDQQAKALGDSAAARRVQALKSDPEATAAAMRTGMVISGFMAAAIAVMVPPRLLDVSLATVLESNLLTWFTPLTSAMLVALLATAIDMSLRSAALQKPESWVLTFSPLGSLVVKALYPIVRGLVFPLNLLLKPFNTKVSFQAPPPPLEELEKLLQAQAQNNEVDKNAPQLIRSIFALTDKTCRDVMVPRTDVVAISLTTPPRDILTLISEQNHSRIPVYADNIDRVVGILHVRDLVPMLQNPELILLQDLIRPAVFVPWVKPIGDLLRDMQKQRIHMAVVVDEYGGFSGIVTLEDILREIVGEIKDEFDEEDGSFEKQLDGSFLVDAMVSPADFSRQFDFVFPEGDFETLGGYLSTMAGAIPEVGDKFTSGLWSFTVQSKDGPRLDRIRVIKPKALTEERSVDADGGKKPVAPETRS